MTQPAPPPSPSPTLDEMIVMLTALVRKIKGLEAQVADVEAQQVKLRDVHDSLVSECDMANKQLTDGLAQARKLA